MTVGQILKLGREIAKGLAAAHERGLIHRDIKPANIWLDATTGGRVKILDFGLARPAEGDAHLTQSGMIVGTAAYMAPEQARSEKVDARADLFSLGCVLYRLCTGRLPWQGNDVMATLIAVATTEPPPVAPLNPDLPPKLAQLVMALLAKDPDDRPKSAKAVVETIQAIERELTAVQAKAAIPVAALVPIGPGPTDATATLALPTPREPARSPFPKKRLLVGLAAGGVLGLLLLAGATFWLRPRPSKPPDTEVPKELTNSIGMKLALIPAGKFTMGSPGSDTAREADETPQHEVVLTQPFYMGIHKVTVAQFKAFVIDAKYVTEAEKGNGAVRAGKLDSKANWQNPGFEQTDDQPVVCVSWNDANAFCRWLSQKEGKRYGLPTEAQWEYACRAGSQTKFYFGDDEQELPKHAWYVANSDMKTRPVGQKKPNTWGLYDMHGNTLDWTADWYAADYNQPGPKEDQPGPRYGFNRVLRGGTFRDPPGVLRDAWRYSRPPEFRGWGLGFRVVCRTITTPAGTKQVEAVVAELMKRNPGFDGQATHTMQDGVVTELEFVTDNVTDISPVRAITGLKVLNCTGSAAGKGQLADLSPLKDMKLTSLHCGHNPVADLSPLKGMSLTNLHCGNTKVSDLSPLRGIPLTALGFSRTQVADLTPLRGMPLTALYCGGTKIADLSPLRGMPLTRLYCQNTQVADLSPLKGMPLTELVCEYTKVADLSPLRGLPLSVLKCYGTKVADLSPLRGLPLTVLGCGGTQVADLAPLKGMPLTHLMSQHLPQLRDLTPLTGMKLERLDCGGTSVVDLSPLKGMPLRALLCGGTMVSDLAPVNGMLLTTLRIENARVADLSHLDGMNLHVIGLWPKQITKGMEILRRMKSLETGCIGYEAGETWPVAEFWKRYDAGEFK